jgi:hypothetical protein
MLPHPDFPAGPYERTAGAIVEAAVADPRFGAQLQQGLAELEAVEFAELDDHARLDYLDAISGTAFFEALRSHSIQIFYSDVEVWELLGYQHPPQNQKDRPERRFDELVSVPQEWIERAA